MNVFVLGFPDIEEDFPCCLVPGVLASHGFFLTETLNQADLCLSVNEEGELYNVAAILSRFQSN